MSKIAQAFARGKAFIPFITCGDPDLETTAAAVRAAVDNGADLIELGIPREADGFLYVVSSLGVTGARSEIKTDLASMMETVRQNTHIPAAIGFGISTPEQAKRMAELADGVIVGSAIVKLLEQHGKDAPGCIGAYVKTMKDAIR